ncbi:MAG: hypothetical protein QOF56_1409 [Acidobacteriaceae bacterium]|nr:hypothetical protein [Acidobacteriaceae bacterium]
MRVYPLIWLRTFRSVSILLIYFSTCGAHAASAAAGVQIPRVSSPPRLEDFQEMTPSVNSAQLAKVTDFIQQSPSDGKQATERTDVYLGYDAANLYLVWVCWDKDPQAIRGHLTRREAVTPPDDDYVELTLDTFHDQRHGFLFDVNPRGVQSDALWSEDSGPDYSYDTVWDSSSTLTKQGYVVWMSIPFRSIRFHPAKEQVWGVTLMRYVARHDEYDYWPRVSSRISGRLNQEALITGVAEVSPSHNMQFNPYGYMSGLHTLDKRDPIQPRFDNRDLQGKLGLDSKFVFHDSLVLDTTINPDFAQIESDEPQNTVNQRFEVFFPEKRPFFLENSNFFSDTNIGVYQTSRVLFTRRIIQPSFGARLTGKQGPWNLGFFVADDRSPGLFVPDNSPLSGTRAYFAVGRVSHDIGDQSSIGAVYVDREYEGDFNRVGGLDASFRLGKNWTSWFRSLVSSTYASSEVVSAINASGSSIAPPAIGYTFGQNHEAVLNGIGRRFSYEMLYQDITANFHTDAGFVPRTDIRSAAQYFHFYWRPDGKRLVFQGPEVNTHDIWDHNGVGLQHAYSGDWVFYFRHNLLVAPIAGVETDVLRPVDFSGLPDNHKYVQASGGLVLQGSPSRLITWRTTIVRDGTVLVVVPQGQLPITGNETFIRHTMSLKPTGHLEIDNTYILDRVLNGAAHHASFNNHIIRSQWNYQFTRALSLRAIAQYNGLLANPTYSSLQTTKNMNFDFLVTYLVHPGTAVYVGYNSNLENLIPNLCVPAAGSSLGCDPNGSGLVRSNGLINDGRVFFVKVSYLFRR